VTAVIGVTATLREDVESVAGRPLGRFVRADMDYVEGVAEARGAPVVLPPVANSRAAESLLDGLDGLLLSGGSDLDPGYYGEEPVPELGVTVPERDAFEMVLLEHALRRGMPIFGICRGMQVLNVAFGGTLHQHLPDVAGVLVHGVPVDDTDALHDVAVTPGTVLSQAVGGRTSLRCSSHHHQGVDRVGDGLRIAGRSEDGLVEALEAPNAGASEDGVWTIGVQWHPEDSASRDPAQQALFGELVRRAQVRRAA
jgi:putative glutamine amidotransferase